LGFTPRHEVFTETYAVARIVELVSRRFDRPAFTTQFLWCLLHFPWQKTQALLAVSNRGPSVSFGNTVNASQGTIKFHQL